MAEYREVALFKLPLDVRLPLNMIYIPHINKYGLICCLNIDCNTKLPHNMRLPFNMGLPHNMRLPLKTRLPHNMRLPFYMRLPRCIR